MRLKQYHYYGISKQQYKECKDLIIAGNRRNCLLMQKVFLIAMGVLAIASQLQLFSSPYAIKYTFYFLLSLILFVLTRFNKLNQRLVSYLTITLLLSFAIVDSVADPYHVATSFLVFEALSAVMILDDFYAMTVYMIILYIIFMISSFIAKGPVYGRFDTLNGGIFSVTAIVLNFITGRDHVNAYVLSNKYDETRKELQRMAFVDGLSGLLVRSQFMDILQGKLNKQPQHLYAALMDADHFKQINDQYGHRMGDQVIKQMGIAIRQVLDIHYMDHVAYIASLADKEENLAARLGGDEFIMAFYAKDQSECQKIIDQLYDYLNHTPIAFDGKILSGVSFSLGCRQVKKSDTIDTLYKYIDHLMYQAKNIEGHDHYLIG